MRLRPTKGRRIENHLRHILSNADLHRRYHEAGHAYIVKKYGGTIKSIECQEVNWVMPSWTEEEKINIIRQYLAGCAAQCILEGIQFDWLHMIDTWPTKDWSSRDDLQQIYTRYNFFRDKEHLALLSLEVHQELLTEWYKIGKFAETIPDRDRSGYAAH
jgi:hypothetical protein